MTKQLMDTVRWKRKRYDFVALQGDKLPRPEEYGLPSFICGSHCWRGFYADYAVRDKRLYLIDVNDSYDKLSIPVIISSDIIIGRELVVEDYFLFPTPNCYRITYELSFKNGVLVDAKDTSGIYEDWPNMYWYPDDNEEDDELILQQEE